VIETCRRLLYVYENNSLLCILFVLYYVYTRISFGPKRDEVTREWRKLHNEKLNDGTHHPIFFG